MYSCTPPHLGFIPCGLILSNLENAQILQQPFFLPCGGDFTWTLNWLTCIDYFSTLVWLCELALGKKFYATWRQMPSPTLVYRTFVLPVPPKPYLQRKNDTPFIHSRNSSPRGWPKQNSLYLPLFWYSFAYSSCLPPLIFLSLMQPSAWFNDIMYQYEFFLNSAEGSRPQAQTRQRKDHEAVIVWAGEVPAIVWVYHSLRGQ